MKYFLYDQSILNLFLTSYLNSEDIRNPKKIFRWNCDKQNTFIEKGRGNDCIHLKSETSTNYNKHPTTNITYLLYMYNNMIH